MMNPVVSFLCRNQFHDVLPGSSIGMAYEDALKVGMMALFCYFLVITHKYHPIRRSSTKTFSKPGKNSVQKPSHTCLTLVKRHL